MSDVTNAIFKFSKLLLIMCLCAHWLACLFYNIATKVMEYKPDSWITNKNLQDSSISV
jgi:hypothetical protein